MLTRGVNEIQVYLYIRSSSKNYFIIKKGGLLWQEALNVVGVALTCEGANVGAQECTGRTMYPVVVYVCKKK